MMNGKPPSAPAPATKKSNIVGINYGSTFSSIAVLGSTPQCIANEDGERQIASCISFHGDQVYVGNQARQQLIKNPANTICGFRDLIGLKFSQLNAYQLNPPHSSAQVLQHPTLPDTPAYKVMVAPPPVTLPIPSQPTSKVASARGTPMPPGTPAEPSTEELEKWFTVEEINKIFLQSLIKSAQDFLGEDIITHAVISVNSSFAEEQKDVLHSLLLGGGVEVLQIMDEASASVALTTSSFWEESVLAGSKSSPSSSSSSKSKDRLQLVLDIGQSSIHLTLLQIRNGLAVLLDSSSTHSTPDKKVGADALDDILLKFLSADFTKKTGGGVSLVLPTATTTTTTKAEVKAQTKLHLAVEHTKRTLSASSGAATCSVESLYQGYDYTGSINKMRFDLLAKPLYTSIVDQIRGLLSLGGTGGTGIDPVWIDEVVYVGGTASLPGIDEYLIDALGLRVDEGDCVTGHSAGGASTSGGGGLVSGGGIADPSTILARGCVIQASLLLNEREWGREDEWIHLAKSLSSSIGFLVPGLPNLVELVLDGTPLPARRSVSINVAMGGGEGEGKVEVEMWEMEQETLIKKHVLPKPDYSDSEDDDQEEEEYEELKYRQWKKVKFLGMISVVAKGGKSKAAGSIGITLGEDGKGVVKLSLDGQEEEGVLELDVV